MTLYIREGNKVYRFNTEQATLLFTTKGDFEGQEVRFYLTHSGNYVMVYNPISRRIEQPEGFIISAETAHGKAMDRFSTVQFTPEGERWLQENFDVHEV